jgi:hypothetical protein
MGRVVGDDRVRFFHPVVAPPTAARSAPFSSSGTVISSSKSASSRRRNIRPLPRGGDRVADPVRRRQILEDAVQAADAVFP